MRVGRAVGIIGLVASTVMTAVAGGRNTVDTGGAQRPRFVAGIDLVTMGVTATDRQGNLVTDLTLDDFRIVEDGVAQKPVHLTVGLQAGEALATHLGLMLDTSASMENDLKLARSAAIRFLNLIPEAEDITLVDFDTEIRVTRYPQRDFARLVERIRLRKSSGWTALYDALGVYLDGASSRPGRTVLVMYTDGADSRSRLRFDELLDLLRATPVTVYAVGLLEHSGRQRGDSMMRLRQIVEVTGGEAFFPASLKDLDSAYEKVRAGINAQYQLGYVSTNTSTDGRWRKVELESVRPNVRLRSRKGYFAPMVR